ncbi:hypothetical protein MRY87_09645 [bacterium]|nr:hypothetical protein [bacterium]
MKLVIFSPHGVYSPAYATTYMMLRYLHSLSADIVQLQCRGAFSVCERDIEKTVGGGQAVVERPASVARVPRAPKRTIEGCLQCTAEQESFVQFSGAESRSLNHFLGGEDLKRTRQWVMEKSAEELWSAEWYGLPVVSLIETTFHRFSGSPEPRFSSEQHVRLIRQLSLVAIRMAVAGGRCLNQLRPDWLWIPSGSELLTKSFLASVQLRAAGMPKMQLVIFSQVLDGKVVLAQRHGDAKPYRLESVVDSLVDLRSNIATWPKEVVSEFDSFFRYLGITQNQLSLPVAR